MGTEQTTARQARAVLAAVVVIVGLLVPAGAAWPADRPAAVQTSQTVAPPDGGPSEVTSVPLRSGAAPVVAVLVVVVVYGGGLLVPPLLDRRRPDRHGRHGR